MNPQEEYNKSQYLYTPLFCEENIWQLLLALSSIIPMDKMWTLILTNPEKKVLLLNQQASAINQPVVWDYHVILLAEINQQFYIFDFDTRLNFVTPLHEYLQNTFISPNNLPPEFIPYLRKVPAQSFLNNFYSDRSHMKNHIEESEFPDWPIINADKKGPISLADYLNVEQEMGDESQILKVSSLATLEKWLSSTLANIH